MILSFNLILFFFKKYIFSLNIFALLSPLFQILPDPPYFLSTQNHTLSFLSLETNRHKKCNKIKTDWNRTKQTNRKKREKEKAKENMQSRDTFISTETRKNTTPETIL